MLPVKIAQALAMHYLRENALSVFAKPERNILVLGNTLTCR
jgi:hypothetical protein